jgi:hypothetical protein
MDQGCSDDGYMTVNGRIWFEGNPWPEGHAIKECEFRLLLDEQGIGLLLEVVTDDYYAEDPSYFDEDSEDGDEEFESQPDWESKIVWGNYHSCKLSNIYWGIDADTVPRLATPFGRENLRKLHFELDTVTFGEESPKDYDEHVFHIYLLGHDAVASHDILIEQQDNGLYKIHWSGLIAKAYVGDDVFKHRFRAEAKDVPFLGFHIENEQPDIDYPKPKPPSADERKERAMILAKQYVQNPETLIFYPGKGWGGDTLNWG